MSAHVVGGTWVVTENAESAESAERSIIFAIFGEMPRGAFGAF